jgi:hypothetical protein
MKYGAKKCEYDGHTFDSKFEASVYQVLKFREKANEIQVLQVHASVFLSKARIEYKPDFVCLDMQTDQQFFVEAKGFETPQWRLKLKLWKAYGPGKLEIWKGDYRRPFLFKTVIGGDDHENED